jgi:hypothetical protein
MQSISLPFRSALLSLAMMLLIAGTGLAQSACPKKTDIVCVRFNCVGEWLATSEGRRHL